MTHDKSYQIPDILYFYLHEKMNISIDFASIIIAIYWQNIFLRCSQPAKLSFLNNGKPFAVILKLSQWNADDTD